MKLIYPLLSAVAANSIQVINWQDAKFNIEKIPKICKNDEDRDCLKGGSIILNDGKNEFSIDSQDDKKPFPILNSLSKIPINYERNDFYFQRLAKNEIYDNANDRLEGNRRPKKIRVAIRQSNNQSRTSGMFRMEPLFCGSDRSSGRAVIAEYLLPFE